MKIEGKRAGFLVTGILVGVVAILVVVYAGYSRKGAEEKGESKHGTGTSPSPEIAKAKEHFEKGVQFSLKGEYEAAIGEYKKSLELNPSSTEAHNNLGFAYLDKGDIDNAIAEQKKAVELNPDLANGYYGLALALEKKNDTDGAINAWKSYLNLAQPHSKWWIKAKERLENLEKQKKGSEAR